MRMFFYYFDVDCWFKVLNGEVNRDTKHLLLREREQRHKAQVSERENRDTKHTLVRKNRETKLQVECGMGVWNLSLKLGVETLFKRLSGIFP